MLLLILKRLLFGTRPKIVVQKGLRSAEAAADAPAHQRDASISPIERGEMVYAVAVSGANILRDMREAVINTLGGHMTKYEALLDKTIARALDGLSERARAQGL